MSRVGDLQDIRKMFHFLNEAMGNEPKEPWSQVNVCTDYKLNEIKDPWAGMPGGNGVERVSVERARGSKATSPSGVVKRQEPPAKADKQRFQQERQAAAEGRGIVDPWGPQISKLIATCIDPRMLASVDGSLLAYDCTLFLLYSVWNYAGDMALGKSCEY